MAHGVGAVGSVDNATEPRNRFRCSVGMAEFRTGTTVSCSLESAGAACRGDPLEPVVDDDLAHKLLIDAHGATQLKRREHYV